MSVGIFLNTTVVKCGRHPASANDARRSKALTTSQHLPAKVSGPKITSGNKPLRTTAARSTEAAASNLNKHGVGNHSAHNVSFSTDNLGTPETLQGERLSVIIAILHCCCSKDG
jgi:hypothetical protein